MAVVFWTFSDRSGVSSMVADLSELGLLVLSYGATVNDQYTPRSALHALPESNAKSANLIQSQSTAENGIV